MKRINSSLKNRIRVCGIIVTYSANGHLRTVQYTTAMTNTTNTKIRILPLTITSLVSIMGLPMRQLRYFVPSRQTSGHKSGSKRNITMINLKKVDQRPTRNLCEISKTLLVIRTSLLFTLTLPLPRLKLLLDNQIFQYWTQITTCYLALKSAQSLLAEKT